MMDSKQLMPTFLTLIIAAFLQPESVFAGTQAEYQKLNSFCIGFNKWTDGGRKGKYPIPQGYFQGITHYCSAVDAMNRLYTTQNINQKKFLAGIVIGETGYVIGINPESHHLMPELFVLRGRSQMMIDQASQAEKYLMKALQLDPGHVDAYLNLGNLYLTTNRKEKAVEAAKAGLAIDSQHKPLRRLAAKLDIKLEEAKPSAQPQASPPPSALGQKGATQEIKPDATATSPAPVPPGLDKQIADAPLVKKSDMPVDAETTPPKIGSTTNPWCRFCPDTAPTATPAPSNPGAAPKAGQ